MTRPQLLLLLLAGGAAVFLLVLLLFSDDENAKRVKKRLERVGGQAPRQKTSPHAASSLRRKTSDSDIPLLDQLIKTFLPNPEKLRERLERTGRNISLGRYLFINAFAVFFFFGLLAYGAGWAKTVALFAGVALGLYLPHAITGRMGKKRAAKFVANFPEAIDTICRGLRSGLPITETISTVGRELPDPIGIEFGRASDGVRMGRPLEDCLWEAATRIDAPELRFFVIALSIQRETGGNLAETLGNLADLIRKRRQLRLKIKAMSSEANASAMIIGSLPFIMFFLLLAINRDYALTLTNDPRGQILMGGGLTWLCIGIFSMRKMTSFEI